MILDTITFTGADSHVHPDDLIVFSAMVPAIEWGLLLSPKRVGTARYPSRQWCDDLVHRVVNQWRCPDKFRLSLHLCGAYARDTLAGGRMVMDDFGALLGLAQRVQINAHGRFHETPNLAARLNDLGYKKQWILPCNGTERPYLELVATRANAVILQDGSGGRGKETVDWAKPGSSPFGYAGGLRPENIVQAVERIQPLTGDTPIWLDMETGIRDSDDRFQKRQVVRVLRKLNPFLDHKRAILCGV